MQHVPDKQHHSLLSWSTMLCVWMCFNLTHITVNVMLWGAWGFFFFFFFWYFSDKCWFGHCEKAAPSRTRAQCPDWLFVWWSVSQLLRAIRSLWCAICGSGALRGVTVIKRIVYGAVCWPRLVRFAYARLRFACKTYWLSEAPPYCYWSRCKGGARKGGGNLFFCEGRLLENLLAPSFSPWWRRAFMQGGGKMKGHAGLIEDSHSPVPRPV